MKSVSVEGAIRFLNELLQIDQLALAALIDHRVPCNEQLADHPTVQVGVLGEEYEVGMLGILNGLFGTDEHELGFITAIFDAERKIIEFIKTDPRLYVGGE